MGTGEICGPRNTSWYGCPPCSPCLLQAFPLLASLLQACHTVLSSGLGHCPLPGPPHLPFPVSSPPPAPAQSPPQTVPVWLSCISLASQSQPSHHMLSPSTQAAPCHQYQAFLDSRSVAAPLQPQSPSVTRIPQSPGKWFECCLPPPRSPCPPRCPSPLFCSSHSPSHCPSQPHLLLPIPLFSPSHSSSSQAITLCPASPVFSLQLLVSTVSQSHLLFPRFLVLSLRVSPLPYSNQGLSSTGLPRSQKRGGRDCRVEGGIEGFSPVLHAEQPDPALEGKASQFPSAQLLLGKPIHHHSSLRSHGRVGQVSRG